MSEKIYVLHVVGRMDRGGTETLLMNLLRTVDRSVFQLDFVEQTQDSCDYDDEILELGSKIYRCPTISPNSLKKYRSWWRDFLKKHKEYRIIHGHSRGSAPIYLDEANKAGRVTIAHCHNNSHGKGIKGAIRYIWQLPLRNIADYNFACSYDSGISQFGKNGEFRIIKNGIISSDFTWNPKVREKYRHDLGIETSFVVGNVARFEEQKNHDYLLKIFSEILKIKPDSKLLLIGRGSLESRIHDAAKQLKIEDSIIYLGVRDDVNSLLQAMDVFVLPSLFEGLGIVYVEAQAAGLPCFASADVVPQEVCITDLMHYISLNENPEIWAKYIVDHYVNDKNRRNTSSEIIAAGFDIESTAKELCSFYREIYNG